MYKQELFIKVAKKTGLQDQPEVVESVVNSFLNEVSASLKKGKQVTLTGFGKFVVRKKKKRTMRNIANGTPILVPAHKAAAFVVGLKLKRLVK